MHAAGGGVGDGRARQRRSAVGPGSAHREVAADGQVVEVVSGPLRCRAVLAVPARRAVDDAGVARRHGLVADAQAIDDTGSEALDDDVGRRGQREEGLPSVVVLQVELDPAHAAVAAVGEERRLDRRRVRPRAPGRP